jgi:transcriptional regulator with XRE-family HTH domain/phage repressor protein C with HTH and peptisase S24 domain
MAKFDGKRLRQLMREARLTGRALAARVGVTNVTISRIVNERQQPSRALAERIAAALDAPCEDLFRSEGPPLGSIGKTPLLPMEFSSEAMRLAQDRAQASSRHLAAAVGCDVDQLERIRRGQCQPTLVQGIAIATALGIPLENLLRDPLRSRLSQVYGKTFEFDGRTLLHVRERARLGRNALARLTYTTAEHLHSIETGAEQPTAEMVKRIASVLGVPITYLLRAIPDLPQPRGRQFNISRMIELQDKLGITNQELGEAVFRDANRIIWLRSGEWMPDLALAHRIAHVLGVDIDELYHTPQSPAAGEVEHARGSPAGPAALATPAGRWQRELTSVLQDMPQADQRHLLFLALRLAWAGRTTDEEVRETIERIDAEEDAALIAATRGASAGTPSPPEAPDAARSTPPQPPEGPPAARPAAVAAEAGRPARDASPGRQPPTASLDGDVQPGYRLIMAEELPERWQGRYVPVIGKLAAGQGIDTAQAEQMPPGWADEYVRYAGAPPHAVAVHVVGDSMEPRYRDGDMVIVDPARPRPSGICVVLVERHGQRIARLKRLRVQGGVAHLESCNASYPTIEVPAKDMLAYTIIAHLPRYVRRES